MTFYCSTKEASLLLTRIVCAVWETGNLQLSFLGTWCNNWCPFGPSLRTCYTFLLCFGLSRFVQCRDYESPRALLCSHDNQDWCQVGNHRYYIIECSCSYLVHLPAIEKSQTKLFDEAGLNAVLVWNLFWDAVQVIFAEDAWNTVEVVQQGSSLAVECW